MFHQSSVVASVLRSGHFFKATSTSASGLGLRRSPCCSLWRNLSISATRQSSKAAKSDNGDDLDKPIQFTTSKAAQFKAHQSLGGDPFPNAPWYQPFVVSFSVGIFLLYFCVLREENDVDEYIGQPLWQKVPGLEKQQLHVVLEYNRSHDLDTTDIERRLKEIEMQSQKNPK